ncbi:unnamed protein product [Bemisia tabaci]|uniref:GOLD domain-containing protein n=1 Tax=Bemisia tabaci TaxID=7038 RepID=A0A9P0AL19_BEMTA|nr:PREDICTED: transmembrane emp24 domain-containing protein bai [Bemisia tabaci]CAH0395103.1 unnamed protein product [Bemisia tabaci]
MRDHVKYCSLALMIHFALLSTVDGIMFILHPNTRKCLREETRQNVVVTGDYMVSQIPGQQVSYVVTDSKNQILWRQENVAKGKLTFSTETFDTCEICFTSKVDPSKRGEPHEVSLILKHGIEAKNYDGLADAAKLKPLEAELKMLEDLSQSIVDDFSDMRVREEQLRDTNESTNNRVLYFSIFSMTCLLGLATWQVLYLRRFFKAKKLIE